MTSKRGYGEISVADRHRLVHQVAWELENGPVPDGLVLDHVKARGCIHHNCVNVAHLEPVTNAENMRRYYGGAPVTDTHCRNSHARTPENTYQMAGRAPQCKTCNRDAVARYKARKKADL
jgi:hypothetical protein